MTWKDKLELGIKEDAAFRKDNLPESQVRGPEIPAGPGRSPQIPAARTDPKTPAAPGVVQQPGTADDDSRLDPEAAESTAKDDSA